MNRFLIALFLMVSFNTLSQQMDEGFQMLETGKYNEAKVFFENVLKEHPENKTARICYGRAVGLSGNPEDALEVFGKLQQDFPNDFEVKLNYGESLLWNKKFENAKIYYESLIEEQPSSFPALLGYANTLSNLKQYPEALTYVNKALEVSNNNPNALISKKYIHLGYADQLIKAQEYSEAETYLEANLKFYENDFETLNSLANLYLIAEEFEKANTVYETISTIKGKELNALNGLALVEHLKGKEKSALATSSIAFEKKDETTDSLLVNQTTERYVQALIWNKKYNSAEKIIDSLITEKPNENWVLALRSTLNIYKNDFKKSIVDYNQILENDSTSFDGNLGKANTLKALGKYDEAYVSAENTLRFYPNQKDALNFIEQLDVSFTPFLESKTSFSFDNGNNEAVATNNLIEVPLSTKFRIIGNHTYRRTKNTVTNNDAKSNSCNLGVNYQLFPNINLLSNVGLNSTTSNSNDYNNFVADLSVNIKSLKNQVLDLGYKRELQNFNADLLDRDIVMNHYYLNYNLNTNFNLGWFTQYYFTSQSDDNTRHLVFTSIYYNILSKPVLKAGLNYQFITFKDQVPDIYFSPEHFNAFEIFANLSKDEQISKPKSWYYNLTAATGFQKTESTDSQNTYRFQGQVGYKLSNRFLVNLFGIHTNIASTTAAGFTYTELGLRVKWFFLQKPIYKK